VASNSEIETGAIRAAESAPRSAVRRVAALNMHDVQHNNSAPCGAARRRPHGAVLRRAAPMDRKQELLCCAVRRAV